jgi:hypothetical protein
MSALFRIQNRIAERASNSQYCNTRLEITALSLAEASRYSDSAHFLGRISDTIWEIAGVENGSN